MKKVKVKFPDGSIGEVDEKDLPAALQSGAVRVTQQKVKFQDGSEADIDEDDLQGALTAGATLVKKKDNSSPGSKIPTVSLDHSELGTPSIGNDPLSFNGRNVKGQLLANVKDNPNWKPAPEPVKTVGSKTPIAPFALPDKDVFTPEMLDSQEREEFAQRKANVPVPTVANDTEIIKDIVASRKNDAVMRDRAKNFLVKDAANMDIKVDAENFPKVEEYFNEKKIQSQTEIQNLLVDMEDLGAKWGENLYLNPEAQQKMKRIAELDTYINELKKYSNVFIREQKVKEIKPSDYPNYSDYLKAVGRGVSSVDNYEGVKKKEQSILNGSEDLRSKDIRDKEDFNFELAGIETLQSNIIDDLNAGKIDEPTARGEMAKLFISNQTLEARYPAAAVDNLRKYVGDYIAEKRKDNNGVLKQTWHNVVSAAPSEQEIITAIHDLRANDGVEITDEQEKALAAQPDKIPLTSMLGHVYKSTILKGAQTLNSMVGVDNEERKLEFRDPTLYQQVQPGEIPMPVAVGEKNIVRMQPNPKAGQHADILSWATANSVSDVAGTIASYVGLNKVFGVVASKLLGGVAGAETTGMAVNAAGELKPITALTAAQTNLASNILSSTYLNYYDKLEASKDLTDDPIGQKAYALSSSIITGLVFAEINPGKILSGAAGAEEKEMGQKFIEKLMQGKGTLEPEKLKSFFSEWAVSTAKDLGHNLSLVKANQIADIALDKLTNKDALKDRNVMDEMFGALPADIISFLPFSAVVGYKQAGANTGIRNAIRMAMVDPVRFETDMVNNVETGKVSPEDAAQKMNYVKGLLKVYRGNDLNTEKLLSLTPEQRFDYANNLLKENAINYKIKGMTDDLQIAEERKKITLLQEERKTLLDEKSKPAAATQPVSAEDKTTQGADEKTNTAATAKAAQSKAAKNEVVDVPMSEIIGGVGTYKGIKGDFEKEGQRLIFNEENGVRSHDIGNINEIKDKKTSEFEIEYTPSKVEVNNEGVLSINGENFVARTEDNPLSTIKKDSEGNITSIVVREEKTGAKKMFKGSIAEDIAYQLHLKNITKDNETATRFEEYINTPEVAPAIHEGLSEIAKEEATGNNGQVQQPEQKLTAEQLLQQAKDTGKLGVFNNMEEQAALKMIAEQAQNIGEKGDAGRPELAQKAYDATVNQFGEALVKAAIEKYPVTPTTEVKGKDVVVDEGVVDKFTAESGNKMVNSKGEPKTFFHFSDNDFNEFKGQNEEGYQRKHSLTNRGIYFHEAEPMAKYGKNKYEVNLDIKNPFIIDNKTYISDVTNPITGKKIEIEHINADDIKYLKEQGYDGVVAKYPSFQTVVFEPSQIKIVRKNGEDVEQSLSTNKEVVKPVSDRIKKKFEKIKANPIEATAEPKKEAAPIEDNAPVEVKEPSTGVFNVPIAEISTNEKEYQGRKNKFSERSAKNVAENYDPNKLDPIIIYKHPDGKTYVLSGHSRFEGMSRRGEKTIPARYFEGTPAEAKDFALKSNKLGTLQTDIENAAYYREKLKAGESYNALLSEAKENEQEGSAKKIVSLAHLNPSGKAMQALESLEKGEGDTKNNILNIAQKIGDIRSKNDHLTDAHENELFDYMVSDKDNIPTDKDIVNQNNTLNRSINAAKFTPEEPLNLERLVVKSENRIQWEKEKKELEQEQSELKKLVNPSKSTGWTGLKEKAIATLTKGDNTPEVIDRAAEDFEQNKDGIKDAYQKQLDQKKAELNSVNDKLAKHLLREKDLIEGDKNQQSLFAIQQKAEEDLQQMKDIVRDIQNEYAEKDEPITLDDIKAIAKEELGNDYNEQLVEEAYHEAGKESRAFKRATAIQNELSKRIEEFTGSETTILPNSDALIKKAEEFKNDVKYQLLEPSDFITDKEGNVVGVKEEVIKEINDEKEAIISKAKDNGTYLKAPNGKDTKLSPENWVLTRTKRFRDWFGDWGSDPKNASKIVDENGEPLVVYHASKEKFEEFKKDKISDSEKWNDNVGILNKLRFLFQKPSSFGFFFTKDLNYVYDGRKNVNIHSVFLDIKKPLIAKANEESKFWSSVKTDDFDGAIWDNGIEIIAYEPNQIKSTENVGSFSEHPSIMYHSPNGEILGFVHNGKIYLNGEHLNPNTPLHEAGHIWVEVAKEKMPVIYNKGRELIKGSMYLKKALENKFYQEEANKLPKDQRRAYYEHEALAAAIGDKGAQFITEARRKSFIDWAKDLWNRVAQVAGFKNITGKELQDMTLDEFAKRAAGDILKGKEKPAAEEGPAPEPQKAKPGEAEPGQDVLLSHAGMQEIADDFDLADVRPKDHESDIKLAERAAVTVKDWHDAGTYAENIDQLLSDIEKDKGANPLEKTILQQHIANVREQAASIKNIYSKEYDEKINELDRLKRAGAKLKSTAAATLRDTTVFSDADPTMADWMAERKEVLEVDDLTNGQKEEIQKIWDEYETNLKTSDEKVSQAEQRIEELKAELATKTERQKRAYLRNKSQEALKTERADIIQRIQDKLKKSRGETTATVVPYAKELFAIAPDVSKLVTNLIDSGITKLADIVDNVHGALVDAIPGITKRDVHNIIAGDYNKKRPTLTALEYAKKDVIDQAKLINKLEKLQNGEPVGPEKQQRKRIQEITDLRNKIKEYRKYDQSSRTPEQILNAIKKRNEAKRKEIEEKIANKDYTTQKPKPPLDENKLLKQAEPQLWKETMDAINEKEEAGHKFELLKRKDELEKRTKLKKWVIDPIGKAITTAKAFKAGIDDSVTMVQLMMAVYSNPRSGLKAKIEAFKDINNTRFKRQLAALHNSVYWDLIQKSGLDITEPQSFGKKEVEELYSGNLLDNNFKLPFTDKKFNPWTNTGGIFERIFTSMGNNLRLNLFYKRIAMLEEQGKTFESHPEEYMGAARAINELTARGKVAKPLQGSMDAVSPIIWAPKMLASTLNTLGITDVVAPLVGKKGVYRSIPPQQARYLAWQMGKGIGMGIAVMGAFAMRGWGVDKDPRSNTFGNITSPDGNTKYNVFGRFGSLVKTIIQLAGGEKVDASGQEKDIDKTLGARGGVLWKFVRGKMTPAAGMFSDYWLNAQKNTFTKQPITLSSLPKDLLLPISLTDVKSSIEEDGSMALLTRFLPALEGIQVTDQRDYKTVSSSLSVKTTEYLKDRNVSEPYFNPKQIEIWERKDGKLEQKKLADFDEETQVKYEQVHSKIFEQELDRLKHTFVFKSEKGTIKLNSDDPTDVKIWVKKMEGDDMKKLVSVLSGKATEKTKQLLFKEYKK